MYKYLINGKGYDDGLKKVEAKIIYRSDGGVSFTIGGAVIAEAYPTGKLWVSQSTNLDQLYTNKVQS